MAVFTQDCPHCGASKAAYQLVGQAQQPGKHLWNCLAMCPACHGGLLVVLQCIRPNGYAQGAMGTQGDLRLNNDFPLRAVWPQREAATAPLHVPDRVAQAFKEGCEVLPMSASAACAQFRKALEWGLKDLAPEVEAWKLERRIDKLAAEGKLTTALKDWAHQLRLDGNEAVHGDEDPTREHAQAVEQLTRYVLTYLYTLPKSIELARAAKTA